MYSTSASRRKRGGEVKEGVGSEGGLASLRAKCHEQRRHRCHCFRLV